MVTVASDTTNPSVLRGQGSGMIVAAFFGAMWVSWAHPWLARLPDPVCWSIYAAAAAITIALLAAGIAAIRRARGEYDTGNTSPAVRRRIWRRYWLVVIAEVVVLNLLAAGLMGNGLGQYLPPAFAIVVGMHFFPLARIFRVPHFHATAILMTLSGCAATLTIVSGQSAVVAGGANDLACAVALWGTAFVSWLRTREPSKADQAALVRAG